ncbi:putative E3 ubiquitin-protein ligase HERC4 [Hypsibius exemplaris]|uniref:E3 ubiquitin-protein ligase HERC4 n=1 Tax=Hypsibius exemplaris TaxID=2072580 RepID=A0A1W0X501_HYPEX|nr:putative E3 ubiquitin-protein ligase HERC4 [Hypsibius exemplaris]
MEEPSQTALYAWGNSHDGQLGLGSSEVELFGEPQIVNFRTITSSDGVSVVQVATGRHHTLFVMSDGALWSCGNNDFGRLGRSNESGSFRRPGRIAALENHNVVAAAVGSDHSLALSDSGQIFTWGRNSAGQCGRESDEEGLAVPKLIKQLAHEIILQIVAGTDFCLALSDVGDVYSWGENSFGQLALGNVSRTTTPTLIKAFTGLPIKMIAAGGSHSVFLTKSGGVFSSGRNEFGQLGLGDTTDRMHAFPIKSLKQQRVVYVCCGQEHSVALTLEGGVFTFGASGTGQLGHGPGLANQLSPRKVFELMGSPVSQICAGRFHTICYVRTTGKLYGFGLAASGQLGIGLRANSQHPVVGATSLLQPASENGGRGQQLIELFAGGDQSFAVVSKTSRPLPPVDFATERPGRQVPALFTSKAEHFVKLLCDIQDDDFLLDTTTHHELEAVCGSLACWNGSFLGPGEDHFSTSLKTSGVDLTQAYDSLRSLSDACKTRTRESLTEQIRIKLIPSLQHTPIDIECLRVYLSLPLFGIFTTPLVIETIMEQVVPLATAMRSLQKEPEKVLKSWFAATDAKIFEHFVQLYKDSLTGILTMPKVGEYIQQKKFWQGTQSLLDALALLYDVNNRLRTAAAQLPYEMFYVPEITGKVNIAIDYRNWYSASENVRKETLFFCNYPFTFDPQAKTMLLQADSTMQMEKAVNSMNQMDVIHNIRRAVEVGQQNINPQQIVFLNLYVSRANLLEDSLNQIYRFRDDELKRPLKVWFVGEDAEDAGGVKKEFFLLLMRELIDPKYGMFKYYDETHSIYFNGKSFECDSMFRNVGIICGLAIYNSTIVDVRFPLAVYKKLLGIKTSLPDLDGLLPSVRRGLEQLLAYEEEDFEEVFSLNFTVSTDYLGEIIVQDLKPNGANISVTKDNRREYCDLYVDFLLNKSVEKQFAHFAQGFNRVCGGKVLELFHPSELMAMVCGNENYDWRELQECALYKGDFTADHPTIKSFWGVFHTLSLDDKKKFLMFLTGCDRIPILGMKAVRIVIQPMGDENSTTHLPVAHTCFNILDLPRYKDETTLRSKLLTAMEHAQGFGLA